MNCVLTCFKQTLWGFLLMTAGTGFGQGTILFNNHPGNAAVSYADGTNIDGRFHPTARAGLYTGPDGATEDQLTLNGTNATFATGPSAGYVAPKVHTISNVPSGSYAMIQMRAWDSGDSNNIPPSYEIAVTSPSNSITGGVYLGKSVVLRLQTGTSNSVPSMIGLAPFSIVRHAGQSILFNQIPTQILGTPPFALNVLASSGLPVSYTSSNTNVAMLDQNGILTILSSGSTVLTVSQAGNDLFFPATANQQLTVEAAGPGYYWTTFNGSPGGGSADGVGSNARFNFPQGVTLDSQHNIYVVDSQNQTIRKVTAAGVVSTIAGFPGFPGYADGTNGTAKFYYPQDITIDGSGNLYVADSGNHVIRKIAPAGTNWVVSTIAGFPGAAGSANGTNRNARFNYPTGVTAGPSNILYVADSQNRTIRQVTPLGTNWVVTTIAGKVFGYPYIATANDGVGTNATFSGPGRIAVGNGTNLYVMDNGFVRMMSRPAFVTNGWFVTTISGASYFGSGYYDGTNSDSRYFFPVGIAADQAGTVYVTDAGNNAIRKITTQDGYNWVTTTLAGYGLDPHLYAGFYGSTDGTGTNALFNSPEGLTVDANGKVYVADTVNGTIRTITSAGVTTTLAGLPGVGIGNTDGTGSGARFFDPSGIALDANGNLYIADSRNSIIRMITPAGVSSTLAGATNVYGSADGAGSYARFRYPQGLALDRNGNIYVADNGNQTIRMVTQAGVVSTLAGQVGTYAYADGTNGDARFSFPTGVAVDNSNNLYVADSGNNLIRKMTPAGTNWIVTTIAGNGDPYGGATDGIGTNASFGFPEGIVIDQAGNLYVGDSDNGRIREITLVGTNWVVTTIAGWNFGANADGLGTNAGFGQPRSLAIDAHTNIYVSDYGSEVIRLLTPAGNTWQVSTIGGLDFSPGAVDGAGSSARFNGPFGIAVDAAGSLYVCDSLNNTIRKGVFTQYGSINPIAAAALPLNAQLGVTLLPPEAGGQWRFPWEQIWHNSGDLVSNLPAGNYPLQFHSSPGYITTQGNSTVVVPPGGPTFYTNQYYPTANNGVASFGSLTVSLSPNLLGGKGWRFLGESGWRLPGTTASNLLPDVYFIEFEPVAGYSKPVNESVQVFAALNTQVSAGYVLAQSPPANVLLPTPVPAANVSNVNNYPFGFVGQLQSDTGFGSGLAVQANVVLTVRIWCLMTRLSRT